ncbi:hypothetical protein KGV52_01095 [Candidatus Gracilibacteria bacterium]|nr:hypothetical protein [Candidatus Gracilibacteria bacterium]
MTQDGRDDLLTPEELKALLSKDIERLGEELRMSLRKKREEQEAFVVV